MIARLWRGWIRPEDIDAYIGYLQLTGLAEYRATPGNRGAYLLHRQDGDRIEIITMSYWDSLDSVRAFAGDDVTQAVFYPEDDRFLIDRETTVTHFTVVPAKS